MKFRRKPTVVEAQRFDGSMEELLRFVGDTQRDRYIKGARDYIGVRQPWGIAWLKRGDWIVRGHGGQFLVYDAEAFAATYEPVPVEHRTCLDLKGGDDAASGEGG